MFGRAGWTGIAMVCAVLLSKPAQGQVPPEGGAPASAPAEAGAVRPAPVPQPPDQPPVVAGPGLVTVAAGESTVVEYTVSDRETPPTELMLTAAVSDPALLPEGSVRLDGEGPRRAMTIAPPPGRGGVATIQLTVADAVGQVARLAVVVTVAERPATGPVPIPPPVPVVSTTGSPCGCSGGGGSIVNRTFGPVVPRSVLVRGRTAVDGPALLNAAFESLWAGNNAQAAEAAAASAALWDDPRAWDYLALASLRMGDASSATIAARYSAARVVANPTYEREVARALTRAQGPLRNELEAIKAGVPDRRVAVAILASRPDPLRLARDGVTASTHTVARPVYASSQRAPAEGD